MNGVGQRASRGVGAACAVVLAVSCFAIAGCGRDLGVEIPEIPGLTGPKLSDQEQILGVLDDVHRGMQSRKVYKVLAHISRSYADAEGRDYNDMQSYLNELFKEYKEISITRVQPRVYVEGGRARAVETFGTRAEPFNPDDYPPMILQGQMNVYLEKNGNSWQIVEWGRML